MSKPIETHAMSAEPRPGRLHVVLSIVVIGQCIFVFSAGIACLAMTWDPCAMFSGVLLAPLPGFLGIVRYAATFRKHAASARMATIFALILGSLVAFMLVVATIEFLAGGELPPTALVFPLTVYAAPHLWNGFLNRRWRDELVKSGYERADRRFRLSMRELLAAIGVVGVFLGLTTYFVREEGPQYAVAVSADEAPIDLPKNATDVAYCKGGGGIIAIEFATTEEAFRDWAIQVQERYGEEVIAVAEIANACRIRNYESMIANSSAPLEVIVTNGLQFSWEVDDDIFGHGCFDRTTGRAYYYKFSR